MTTGKVRVLPEQKQRVETGAIQFGGDWPGLFMRGDDCISLLLMLKHVVDGNTPSEVDKYLLLDLMKTIAEDVFVPPQKTNQGRRLT